MLEFRFMCPGPTKEIYLATLVDDKINVTWNQSHFVSYHVTEALRFIVQGAWIVIKEY